MNNNSNITIVGHTLTKIKFEKLSKLVEILIIARLNIILTTISERLDGTGEKFTKIMMKLSIIKLALSMMVLIAMTVLFFIHLNTFVPITIQFSKWVSSPIICFIMLVIVAKFVGLGIGLALTMMSIKDLTFEDLKLGLRRRYKLSLRLFFKKKALPQKA